MAMAHDLVQYVPIDFVRQLAEHTFGAQHEDEFCEGLATTLLQDVDCDTVVVLLLDRRIEVRSIATRDGVVTMPPAGLWERFSAAHQRQWSGMKDGVFFPDVDRSSRIPLRFRKHARQLGIVSTFAAPLIYDGQMYGQVVFGWSRPPRLDDAARRYLRGVADISCYHLTVFWLRTARSFDDVTGLRKRDGLDRLWERRDETGPGTIFFADIDGFKLLIDGRGHSAADEYLRAAARTLLDVAPLEASVFRLGMDEFALFVPGMTREEAQAFPERIGAAFQRIGQQWPPPRPSITVGVAHYPEEGTELQPLLDLADERMRRQRAMRVGMRKVFPLPQAFPKTGDADTMLPGDEHTVLDLTASRWLAAWPDGIIVTRPDFEVIYVNETYEKMTGYSLDEWRGKKPSFVASGKTSPKTYEQMWKSINETGTWTGHVINRRRDGTEWVSFLSIIRIVGATGRLVGYLANARDITNSMWKEASGMQDPFQEAFTQEALAFALAEAGQIHEGGSRRHLERIRDYTRLLVLGAMETGCEPLEQYETRTAIVMASILHDIGKLAVPEGLLRKPARLTRVEFELVKSHTIAGEHLLRSPYLSRGVAAPESLFLTTAATIARSHHERWDGKGYPDGLAGEEIPLSARIVAIADVYDALRSPRAYKPAWKHKDTVDYIAGGAGTQFDPDLVRIFVDLEAEFDDIARAISEDRDVRTDGYGTSSSGTG